MLVFADPLDWTISMMIFKASRDVVVQAHRREARRRRNETPFCAHYALCKYSTKYNSAIMQ
jgi:hypothetical protein